MTDLAERKPAWDYRMIHGALRLDGWHFNHKMAHRHYREEKLALRRRSKKRLKCKKRGEVEAAM
jgi:hypothetical protein